MLLLFLSVRSALLQLRGTIGDKGMKTIHTVMVGVAWFTMTALLAKAELQFFPLGDLPGGVTNSAAYGVSADGQVVVGYASTAAGPVAFQWTEGGGLVALPMLSGGTGSIAYAASADGSVIVGGTYSATGQQASVWATNGVAGLGDLVGGSVESMARGVSADGQVIVGYANSASGREAFRWTGNVMTGLGDLAGGSYQSEAYAVTPDGTRVTGYGTPGLQRIFLWDPTNLMQDYYPSATAWAHGISSSGNTLVGRVRATYVAPGGVFTYNYWRAAIWNSGLMTIVGPESTGDANSDSVFNGITPDASLIVGSFRGSSGPYYAISQDSFNGVRNLKTMLINAGVDAITNWTLTAATAISADGSVVVGYGTNPEGQQEAWVIKGYGLNLILRWVGNNAHWPANGDLTSADDLWMNIDSKDLSVGVTGVVVYSADKGITWNTAPLARGTPGADYDHWYQNLGSFPAGATIRYSLAVEDADGYQLWDNNQGKDYYAVVSPGYTGPVGWVGNDGNNGTVGHTVSNVPLQSVPSLALTNIQNGVAHLLARELQPGYIYTVDTGATLDSWTNAASLQPAGTNAPVSLTNSENTVFYRVKAAATSSYIVVTREVWPQDSGKTARMGYRLNGGDWHAVEMSYVGQVGNNDIWRSMVGPITPGTAIEYYVEVISAAGGGLSYYDNNDNSNYSYTAP